MTKFFALVVCLSTLAFSLTSYADDSALASAFKTKEIVRLKLWYDGLDSPQKTLQENEQNQEVKAKPMKEELSRVLNKIDL